MLTSIHPPYPCLVVPQQLPLQQLQRRSSMMSASHPALLALASGLARVHVRELALALVLVARGSWQCLAMLQTRYVHCVCVCVCGCNHVYRCCGMTVSGTRCQAGHHHRHWNARLASAGRSGVMRTGRIMQSATRYAMKSVYEKVHPHQYTQPRRHTHTVLTSPPHNNSNKARRGFWNRPKIIVDWNIAQEERKATWFEVRDGAIDATAITGAKRCSCHSPLSCGVSPYVSALL